MRCTGCIWIENEGAGCSTRELMCLFKKSKDYVSRQLVRRGAYWEINGVTCRFRWWQWRDIVALQMERFPSVHIVSLSADGARNPLGDARHESDWTNLWCTDKPTTWIPHCQSNTWKHTSSADNTDADVLIELGGFLEFMLETCKVKRVWTFLTRAFSCGKKMFRHLLMMVWWVALTCRSEEVSSNSEEDLDGVL